MSALTDAAWTALSPAAQQAYCAAASAADMRTTRANIADQNLQTFRIAALAAEQAAAATAQAAAQATYTAAIIAEINAKG